MSGLGLFIEYIDSNGERSARRIACRRYEPREGMIRAWCFEREAHRCFRIDRIVSAACTVTGKVFDKARLVEELQRTGTPVRDSRLWRVMQVLVFMMRCDGLAHPAERKVLRAAAASFVLRFGGDDAVAEAGEAMALTLAPDWRDFDLALKWIARHRQHRELARFAIDNARAVIEADGVINNDETLHAIEIDAALRRLVAG